MHLPNWTAKENILVLNFEIRSLHPAIKSLDQQWTRGNGAACGNEMYPGLELLANNNVVLGRLAIHENFITGPRPPVEYWIVISIVDKPKSHDGTYDVKLDRNFPVPFYFDQIGTLQVDNAQRFEVRSINIQSCVLFVSDDFD